MLLKKSMWNDETMMSTLSRLTTYSAECLNALPRLAQLDVPAKYWHLPRMIEYPWTFAQIKSKGERILDVGTGIQFWVALFSMGYDITIHHTSHDLDKLSATYTGVGWCSSAPYLFDKRFKAVVGLPQDLDFVKDECFDTILNVSVMEHVPSDQFDLWMDGLWRLLRPGGKMIVTCDWPFEYPFGKGIGGTSWFINHDWRPFIARTKADVTEADGVPWANGADNKFDENDPDNFWLSVSPEHPPKPGYPTVKLAVYGFVLHKP